MLTYRGTIPGLSTAHLRHLSALSRRHRVTIRCRWRKLVPARQALLVLAHLRCGDTFAQLAGSFAVSATTAYRYVTEAVDVLAATAVDLDTALAARAGEQVTILDGTIVATQRVRCVADHKRWYVHRKKTYGINPGGHHRRTRQPAVDLRRPARCADRRPNSRRRHRRRTL